MPASASIPAGAVLYLSGRPGATMRYRCEHQADQLRHYGASVEIAELREARLGKLAGRHACVILHRVPHDSRVEAFVERCRAAGSTVVFDTDDLIFDERFAEVVPPSARLKDGLARHARTMAMVDAVTVSTAPLAEIAVAHNPSVRVLSNVAGLGLVALSDAALASRPVREDLRIGYLSGTATHDNDFLMAAAAVLWALEHHPEVRFYAVGRLGLDSRFDRWGDRVVRVPLQPWDRLPELLAKLDVNLAPLEQGNVFGDCKSCIKYIEAGLVAVPTVASRRPDFVRAIAHGVNGLLAEDRSEWQDAIRSLVEDADLRRRVGASARADVVAHHTATARGREARETLRSIAGTNRGRMSVLVVARHELGRSQWSDVVRALRENGHHVTVHVQNGRDHVDRSAPQSYDALLEIGADSGSVEAPALFRLRLTDAPEDAPSGVLPVVFGRGTSLPSGGREPERLESPAAVERLLQETCFVRAPT
jgi:glycosyltransferase involved in cell wall biosynthesis